MTSTCDEPSLSVDFSDEDDEEDEDLGFSKEEPSFSIRYPNEDVDIAFIKEEIKKNAATADSVEVVCAFSDNNDQALTRVFSQISIPIFIEMGIKLTKLRSIVITVEDLAQYEDFNEDEMAPFNEDATAPFPIYALKHLLQLRADSLVSVKLLRKVRLVGSQSEFQETCAVLSKSKILKDFTMESCSVEVVQDEGASQSDASPLERADNWVQDSLVDALSDVDTLQKLVISDVELTTTLHSPLVKLCQWPRESTTKRECMTMNLWGLNLSRQLCGILCAGGPRITKLQLTEDHVIYPMAHNLKTNSFLKELQMLSTDEEVALVPSDGIRLLVMLQENDCLESLSFGINCNGDSQYGKRFTNAVKNMGHLKRLFLQFYDRDISRTTEAVTSLLEGLTENQSLTHLVLNLCDGVLAEDYPAHLMEEISCGKRRITAELANTLQTNKLLQCVKVIRNGLVDLTINKEPEVRYWLTLNRCGRHYLETHLDDRAAWVNTVIEHKNEPRVTFYFLITNPNICQLMAGSLVPQKRKIASCN